MMTVCNNTPSTCQRAKLWAGSSPCKWTTHSTHCSDVHFCRCLVIDQLKSPKTDSSNPYQDIGPNKTHFWWSCPLCLFFMMPRTSLLFSHQTETPGQHKTLCWQMHLVYGSTMFWPKYIDMYGARSKHIMLCRLYSWTESKFMTRNHSTAAVPELTVSGVNFNFFLFSHNHEFYYLQTWCPTVPASSGHQIIIKFYLQDILSSKVLKQCVTLTLLECLHAQVTQEW